MLSETQSFPAKLIRRNGIPVDLMGIFFGASALLDGSVLFGPALIAGCVASLLASRVWPCESSKQRIWLRIGAASCVAAYAVATIDSSGLSGFKLVVLGVFRVLLLLFLLNALFAPDGTIEVLEPGLRRRSHGLGGTMKWVTRGVPYEAIESLEIESIAYPTARDSRPVVVMKCLRSGPNIFFSDMWTWRLLLPREDTERFVAEVSARIAAAKLP